MTKKIIRRNKAVKRVHELVMGFLAPFHALTFILEHKGLKRYFIIPFFLNIFVLSLLFVGAFTYLYPMLIRNLPQGDSWYLELLAFITGPILFLLTAIVAIFLYSIMGGIICAPFHDPLSAKVEGILHPGIHDESFSFKVLFEDIVRAFKNMAKLFGIMLACYTFLFLLNLFPPLGNILYFMCNVLILSFFLGFQFFDYSLERKRLLFAEKFKILWKYKWMTIGVGGSFFVLSLIPLVGFLSLTLGTVGATKLYVEEIDTHILISNSQDES